MVGTLSKPRLFYSCNVSFIIYFSLPYHCCPGWSDMCHMLSEDVYMQNYL